MGIAATRQILGAFGNGRPKHQKASHGSGHWSLELLLMGLPVLQQVLSQALANVDEEDEHDHETFHASSHQAKEAGAGWLQALLPIGISLLRNFIESKIGEDDDPEFQ